MRKYSVRKILGLLALYVVLIVGILVLQFKTESVLNKTAGGLRISMAQTQGDGDNMKLKNQFQASFNGLLISANNDNSAKSFNSAAPENVRDLVLESFTENYQGNSNAFQLSFTDGSSVVFQTSTTTVDENETEVLTVIASPSNGNDVISLPYKFASTHSIEEFATGRVILNSGKTLFALSAPNIGDDRLNFVTGNNIATYGIYSPASKFEFVAVTGMPLTDSAIYNTNIKQFREALVTKFAHPSASESDYSEDDVVAYVAEMAVRGNFSEGINAVPDSFKRGSRRTYVSVPYFGKLASLDRTLDLEVENMNSMVKNAVDAKNMDVFTVKYIDDFILREKKKDIVKKLLSFPSELYTASVEGFNPTIEQITGMISVYANLLQNDMEMANLLAPVMEPCMEILASHCSIVDDRLVMADNEVEISKKQQIITGQALLSLGLKTQRADYADAGHLMLNQGFEALETFNLQTLSELYPLLVKENRYYPHCQVLGYYGTNPVWTWTCSPAVSYKIGNDGIVSINLDFPLNSSQYVYVKGVPTFHAKIEIQQLMYRSDPTFESYNSSGYVYNGDTKSLYLKSRHKSRVELIRLWCDPVTNFTTN